MCGISGVINRDGEKIAYDLIKSMNDKISHRGPDDEGFFIERNFALGHRRLSILDLSKNGHQPMSYQDRFFIVFNGEIYNYLELRAELSDLNFTFNSNTDTEVILAAYSYWGSDCLNKLNGMWSFAIYDKVEDNLFMARDRFGVKPFYYLIVGKYFAFASEIKAFTAIPEWRPQMNLPRALDFLLYGISDYSEETLFAEVLQLRGGYYLNYRIQENSFSVKQWYNIEEKVCKYKKDYLHATTDFKNIFFDSIKLRLRSDVKVGSCLSGGIDSSSIVCAVNKVLREKNITEIQESVSSCFPEKQFDEQIFIDEVILKTKIKGHKVYPELTTLFSELEKITWHQDEPIPSASIFAQFNVFSKAKENNLKVMLDGQGADEIFSGYDPYYYSTFNELLLKFKFKSLVEEINYSKKYGRFNKILWIKNISSVFLPQWLITRQKTKENYKFIKKNVLDYFKQDSLISKNKQFSRTIPLSISQLRDLSIPMLLHNADRMSMSHSIESRLPFLDFRLVEFALSLPAEYKIKNGLTKYIIRESLSDLLPKKIVERTDKMGFVTPEVLWIHRNKELFEKELWEAGLSLEKLVNTKDLIMNFNADLPALKAGSIYWRIIAMSYWIKTFNVNVSKMI